MNSRYLVKEVFASVQGEGVWTGKSMIFLRFGGCNLRCPYCDTAWLGGTRYSEDDLIAEVKGAQEDAYLSIKSDLKHKINTVCLTGGEPLLQCLPLVPRLKAEGFFVHIETNGTIPLPRPESDGIDWVSCAPKEGEPLVLEHASEVKVVTAAGQHPFMGPHDRPFPRINAPHWFLQPMNKASKKNEERVGQENCNDIDWPALRWCILYVKHHPTWRLSPQLQKFLKVR